MHLLHDGFVAQAGLQAGRGAGEGAGDCRVVRNQQREIVQLLQLGQQASSLPHADTQGIRRVCNARTLQCRYGSGLGLHLDQGSVLLQGSLLEQGCQRLALRRCRDWGVHLEAQQPALLGDWIWRVNEKFK